MLTFLLVLFFIGIIAIICGIGFFIFDIIKSKPFKSTAILTVIGLILSIGSYQIAQKRMAHEDAVAVKQIKGYLTDKLNLILLNKENCRYDNV